MRSRTVLLLAGTLVAVPLAGFALFTAIHWDPPEIRLNQLLRNQGAMSSGEALMAEFRIQAPSGSTIWLKDESVVVELLRASGDWTTIRRETPLVRAPITSIVNNPIT